MEASHKQIMDNLILGTKVEHMLNCNLPTQFKYITINKQINTKGFATQFCFNERCFNNTKILRHTLQSTWEERCHYLPSTYHLVATYMLCTQTSILYSMKMNNYLYSYLCVSCIASCSNAGPLQLLGHYLDTFVRPSTHSAYFCFLLARQGRLGFMCAKLAQTCRNVFASMEANHATMLCHISRYADPRKFTLFCDTSRY